MKFISKGLLAAGAAFSLAATPVAAQESAMPDDDVMQAMRSMFPVEPLTAEQEARLPIARGIVAKMIPEGTLGDMMGSMFDKMMGPIMELASSNPEADVARQLGLDPSELELTEEQAAELAGILDPAWRERNAVMGKLMPEMMKDMMTRMEPTMRKAMSEAYAIHFNANELADIDAFFSTPSGLSFARKSFSMSSDPRILGASMEALPSMFESIGEMEAKMTAATADLPAPRRWGDLTASQKSRISALTGLDQDEVEANMEFVDAMKEAGDE
ncbi:hypothetical protein AMC99_02676 [Altererythrobacter epoxidivorans]|uniref:DUF2059 domain-containing protein n=1 Tax=Altererythrobacter epoxidivorans TaxID=361183 RepID=A0A0M4LXJ1_9SPHN|nr:DUF2059 domain-containing protein [Altererythrobacter epoxidivorans]ALE17947.1 hypothetical protein AMC99_02676 [Altererythrobacter epoxidivorans]